MSEQTSSKPRRVFILGGGAGLGAHQVGALKYLDERGIKPDVLICSSIGVINGCVYGSGGVVALEEAWKNFYSLPLLLPSWRDNPLRGFGIDGVLPAAGRGQCKLGACRIWDWSAAAADGAARGALAAPIGGAAQELVHTWTVSGASGCAALSGATWNGTTCTSRMLVNAVELSGDAVGNDNLLCEAGERCLHTPNIGAYQGHGALVPAGTGGVSNDVELFARAVNGR